MFIITALTLAVTIFEYSNRKENINSSGNATWQNVFINLPQAANCEENLKRLTSWERIASTADGKAAKDYVEAKFKEYGLPTVVNEYQVLLSFPLNASILLLAEDG